MLVQPLDTFLASQSHLDAQQLATAWEGTGFLLFGMTGAKPSVAILTTEDSRVTIGACRVDLWLPGLEPNHCSIRQQAGHWILEATHETLLNNEPIQGSAELKNGHQVSFTGSPARLCFCSADALRKQIRAHAETSNNGEAHAGSDTDVMKITA